MYHKQDKLSAYMHAVKRIHSTLLATFMTPLRSDAIKSKYIPKG